MSAWVCIECFVCVCFCKVRFYAIEFSNVIFMQMFHIKWAKFQTGFRYVRYIFINLLMYFFCFSYHTHHVFFDGWVHKKYLKFKIIDALAGWIVKKKTNGQFVLLYSSPLVCSYSNISLGLLFGIRYCVFAWYDMKKEQWHYR